MCLLFILPVEKYIWTLKGFTFKKTFGATYLIQLLNYMLEQTLEELMGFAQEHIARVRYERTNKIKT